MNGGAGIERAGSGKKGHGARVRTCAGCGAKRDKAELLRIVRTPEGEVLPDLSGRRDGRGAYVCFDAACVKRAQKRRGLERTLQTGIPKELFEVLREVTEKHGAE